MSLLQLQLLLDERPQGGARLFTRRGSKTNGGNVGKDCTVCERGVVRWRIKKKEREMKNREFGLGQFLTSSEVALPGLSADISTYRWRYSSTSYLLLLITLSNSNHWDDFMHALLIWHNALGFRQTELCCIGNRSSEVRGAATTSEEKLQQMSRLFLSSRATFTDHFMALWGKISDLQRVEHFALADILFPG